MADPVWITSAMMAAGVTSGTASLSARVSILFCSSSCGHNHSCMRIAEGAASGLARREDRLAWLRACCRRHSHCEALKQPVGTRPREIPCLVAFGRSPTRPLRTEAVHAMMRRYLKQCLDDPFRRRASRRPLSSCHCRPTPTPLCRRLHPHSPRPQPTTAAAGSSTNARSQAMLWA